MKAALLAQKANVDPHKMRYVAFEGGGGQDFGLAAAIATLIFLLVGALAIVNLKATRMKFD